MYRCMLCSVSFRISFPLPGRYDGTHRSATLTMMFMKLPYDDLRPSWDRFLRSSGPFGFHVCEDLSWASQLRRPRMCSGPSRVHMCATRYVSHFAYCFQNRTPPIDDRDRLFLFVMERIFLGTLEISSWIYWTGLWNAPRSRWISQGLSAPRPTICKSGGVRTGVVGEGWRSPKDTKEQFQALF